MSSVFGTPRFGNSGGDFKRTRAVGAGDTFFRALPPMFSLRESGDWRKYFATHWGYEAASDRDPAKKFQKPFRCIEDKDRRSGLIRQECPACVKRAAVEKELAEKEKAIRELMAGKDEAVIVARLDKELAPIVQWLEDHRVDGKWYINAKFKDGSFGSIKLNHKFHMNRILEIINGRPATADKPAVPGLMEAEGINPLAPDQGVWFVVHRTGAKRSVVDTTDIEMENVVGEVNGVKRNLKQIVLAPLTEEECEKAGVDCEDLATLGGAELTYEQIDSLVNGTAPSEAEAEPTLAEMMAARAATAKALSDAQAEADKALAAKVAAAAAEEAQKAAAAAAAPAPTPTPEVKKQEPGAAAAQADAIKKRLAEIAAREAAKKAAEEAAAAAAAQPAVNIADMSDADFMRDFGPGAGGKA